MNNRFEHFSVNIFNIVHYWNILASEEMKKHGLRGGYALYLIILYNSKEELTAARLAELCHRDKADVSRAISVFQEKGILEPYGDVRYRAPLRLTAEGKELSGQINIQAIKVLDIVGMGMTDEVRAHMYEGLDTIALNMKHLAEGGLPT
jgi:DNA-binding MarR family transcriptional regulator